SDLLRVITSGRWPVTAPRREGPSSAQASIPPSARRGESRKWSWSKSVRHKCFPGEGGAKDADHSLSAIKGCRRRVGEISGDDWARPLDQASEHSGHRVPRQPRPSDLRPARRLTRAIRSRPPSRALARLTREQSSPENPPTAIPFPFRLD